MNNSKPNKKQIRHKLIKARDQLTPQDINLRSKKICQNIINNIFSHIDDINNKKIALYLAVNNEVATNDILDYLENDLRNQNIAIPKINPSNNCLDFKIYNKNSQLYPNQKYPKIAEPSKHSPNITPQIILVPLVACDKNGNRIGMGGGFYDRTITKLRQNYQNITLIGICYDFQILEQITSEKFDQTLDFIACEDMIIKVKHKKKTEITS